MTARPTKKSVVFFFLGVIGFISIFVFIDFYATRYPAAEKPFETCAEVINVHVEEGGGYGTGWEQLLVVAFKVEDVRCHLGGPDVATWGKVRPGERYRVRGRYLGATCSVTEIFGKCE